MYLDEAAYESTPSTGWPRITPDSMRSFDKTDEVVELLRHLPYPSDEDPDRRPQIMFGAILCRLPARRLWTRNDRGVLLDTKLGVVFWHEAATEFKWFSPFPVVMGLAESDDEDSSEGEGEGDGNAIFLRFATLKHNLKELHFVPMSRRRVVDGWYGPDAPDEHSQKAVEMVKDIYRAHGWPDLERYRKEDCLKAIYTALSENFPGEEDEDDAELLEDDA
ncbi:hypothetical protein B0H66DRAFT_638289 [Apodospora peruviana]|uniref:Uncharacterized protein n=1 Tax=Apodospora peruviana TaxID=516989 RepID=A0AAE0IB91_9PEZI|nr:hypothetical protein B0H66DRAFT_638289 [Apodospora peruviana]